MGYILEFERMLTQYVLLFQRLAKKASLHHSGIGRG
jgi:hypothetical protein